MMPNSTSKVGSDPIFKVFATYKKGMEPPAEKEIITVTGINLMSARSQAKLHGIRLLSTDDVVAVRLERVA